MTLKVLPLDRWMRTDPASMGYSRLKPVFRRSGVYLDTTRRVCWFEHDGRAWAYSARQFELDLHILSVLEMSQRQIDALQAVVRENLATKEQRKILQTYLLYCPKRSERLNNFRRRRRFITFLANKGT